MNSPKLEKARHLMGLKKYAEALALYATVVKQFPQGGGEYGRAAADSGDFDLAFQIWEQFLRHQPGNAGLMARLAEEYQTIGLYARARELLAKAAEIEQRNLELQLKRAALLARTSSIDSARAAIAQCLELDARNPQALFLQARMQRRAGELAQAENQLRDLLASPPSDSSVHYSIHAELAQILDSTRRFDEAMTVLAQGKALARQAFHFAAERKAFYERHSGGVAQAVALPKSSLEKFAASFPTRARNAMPPVAFLSGCARSGTTLLERILDAHPKVAAFDESPAFKAIQQQVESSTVQGLNLLRHRYVKNLTAGSNSSANDRILLDKSPSRTLWLPGMLRLFPDLRCLIALRDPRDIMVSLYFQDHVGTNFLSLEELAHHYRQVMEVWLAVREWTSLTWMETRYEDVVADLPKEGARVTKFLGLEWHENQTRFFESNLEKPVMSTNYHDVSQPVYKRAVGRWQVYEKHLAPVFPVLEPFCQTFGYA
jgi:tetratricopeptide (TPR) repeat protein